MIFSHLFDHPLIHADDDPRLEGNVNGPSLIRVPDWAANRLGNYYLYFAHHKGETIRLAAADELAGPWKLHEAGALALADSHFPTEPPAANAIHPEAAALIAEGVDGIYPHIASPDVHVDNHKREMRMYFHGRLADGRQRSRVAVSQDGLQWSVRPGVIGKSYLRSFQHDGAWFSLTMPGFFCRSADGLAPFNEAGDIVFGGGMRHSALLKRGDWLFVFWTRIGDSPERILLSQVDLSGDWREWSAGNPVEFEELHRPTAAWEGSNLPLGPSKSGAIMRPVNQLRDPAIFEEDGEVYLLYSVQGEQGIGIGRLKTDYGIARATV